jgi:hypothetical protein
MRSSKRIAKDLAMRSYTEIFRDSASRPLVNLYRDLLRSQINICVFVCFRQILKYFFINGAKLIISQSFRRSRFKIYRISAIKILHGSCAEITRRSRVEILTRSLYEILHISCYEITRRSRVKIFR